MLNRNRILIAGIIIWIIVGLLLILFYDKCFALERCKQYAQQVRVQHWTYFGMGYPYHYGLGQLQQESNCRADVTAFDGGQGLSQFMPKTEEYCERWLGSLDMYNASHAIKAQAWYMAKIHKQNWDGGLWLTYMFYNSGSGTVIKEYRRAGRTDYVAMRTVCSRKVLTLKNGSLLNLCDVGYDYPKKIFTYGKKYQLLSDDEWRYW